MTILHRSESNSVAPRSHASISYHFQPRWWMNTKISIRAIFTTICPQRIQLKQMSRKLLSVSKIPNKVRLIKRAWNLLLLGNFLKIAIMMCDSDLQGNKSKFQWFSGFIWCVMILIYSFYLCAEAWWHTRFLLSTSVFLHSSHLKLSVCCAFLCRSMIKCFPAFITCALLAPFDVVFIVFLPFELSATCFALALCKDPSIKVLSTIVPFVSSPKNWTLLVTCPMYDVIWLSKFDEINFAVSNVWFLDELNCHFFATPSPLPLLSLPTNPQFKTEMIT